MAHCPCKRAKSVTRYLENYTSNYLKFCVLNGLMPVITVEEGFRQFVGLFKLGNETVLTFGHGYMITKTGSFIIFVEATTLSHI